MMSSLVRSTFINVEVPLFFAAYFKMRTVLIFLRKTILASQWVENLLKVSQVLRE